jgi:hypothetical protein
MQSVYSVEGPKGLIKEGGTARKEAIAKAIAVMGGTLEAFYNVRSEQTQSVGEGLRSRIRDDRP